MLTFLKTSIIVLLGVVLSLLMYQAVDARFAFGPQGMTPAFAWLLQVRAAENGGQIAPSFDELGMTGGAFPMGAAAPQETAWDRLTEDVDLVQAREVARQDLGRLLVAVLGAVLLEVVLRAVLPKPARRTARTAERVA